MFILPCSSSESMLIKPSHIQGLHELMWWNAISTTTQKRVICILIENVRIMTVRHAG